MKFDIGAVLTYYGGAAPNHRHGWAPCKCPFHEDRNPSAAVNFAEGRFHCFVCDLYEDAIGLIMERERCDFSDAKRQAEAITGQSDATVPDQPDLGGWFPARARNKPGAGRKVGFWRRDLADALA